MEPIQNTPVPTNLGIHFSGRRVSLPAAIRSRIDEYWQGLIVKNPELRNGEVFTVTTINVTTKTMTVILTETNYAHYLYSQKNGDLGDYTVRIIHPAALVVTSDNKFIIGSMGEHTSRPGIIQCCGGGIDHSDIKSGIVDIDRVITRELAEEIGIDVHDKNLVKEFRPVYLKSGGPTGKITISYILQINQTFNQFMSNYRDFTEKLKACGHKPEFGEIFCVENSHESIQAFIEKYGERLNEYVAVLLRDARKYLLEYA